MKKQWFLYGFHEIANFMKMLIKLLFFQSFMGVGLLEIVAKLVIQDSFWLHVEGVGPSWAHVGPSWTHVGSSWRHVGPSWPDVGLSWTYLGPILTPSWPILAPRWANMGP